VALAVENALSKILAGSIGVTDLVSARIYPHMAVQSAALPYIAYMRISGTHEHHMDSASGLARARVQIDCLAATYDGAKTLADKVRLALDGFVGDVTIAGQTLTLQDCFLSEHRDGYDTPVNGKDTGIPRVMMDFSVWYEEVIPTFS
jgi:hypothetical protein